MIQTIEIMCWSLCGRSNIGDTLLQQLRKQLKGVHNQDFDGGRWIRRTKQTQRGLTSQYHKYKQLIYNTINVPRSTKSIVIENIIHILIKDRSYVLVTEWQHESLWNGSCRHMIFLQSVYIIRLG